MRAIVLLCLLHAAFSERRRYSWNGPIQLTTTMSPTPNEDNACLTDQMSCGCCLMQTQMERMEGFFNLGLEEMRNELTRAKKVLDNMRARRSAFSVALSSESAMKCHVPFTVNKNIVYQHVFLNLGGGYDEQTGIFTAPCSGVYSLALTLYGNAVFLGEKLSTCASLQVNTQVVGSILERNGSDREDSATVFVAVKLKAGDQVAVSLLEGCFICDDNNHYNTFTGFYLYSTD